MSIDPTALRLSSAGVAYAPEIASAARRHHLDPGLLAAVAAQETGGPGSNAGRNVVGDGGHGHGLFQIDDRSHSFAQSAAAMDPGDNADYAAGMLEGLINQYGDVRSALSAYNSGDPHAAGSMTDWGDGESLDYADSVFRHYQAIAGGVPATTSAAEAADSSFALAQMQATQLPMPALPSMQSQQPQSYHRQETDYMGLFDSGDSSNSDDSTIS